MNAIQPLNSVQCAQVSGGLGPLLAAAYAVVTSETFIAWAATVTLIGVAADIGSEVID